MRVGQTTKNFKYLYSQAIQTGLNEVVQDVKGNCRSFYEFQGWYAMKERTNKTCKLQ